MKAPPPGQQAGGTHTTGMLSFSRNDITQSGHILGDATQLNNNVLPERELSASETSLVRFLLHASMFLACNENPQVWLITSKMCAFGNV